MAYARVSAFYGFTVAEIEKMHMDVFIGYGKAIEVMKAEDALISLDTSSYPHLKDDKARGAIRKKFMKIANPERMKQGISFSDFARTQKNG